MMRLPRPDSNPRRSSLKRRGGTLRVAMAKVALALAGPVTLSIVMEAALRFNHAHASGNPHADWDRSPMYYDFTGSELAPPEEGSCIRLAVVGDSFAQGAGVQTDDRYAARLERALNTHPGMPHAEVECHALAGTSTYQQKPLLHAALQSHPSVVILGICLNDTEDWTRPDQLTAWREEWLPAKPGGMEAWLAGHSELFTWLRERSGAARMKKGHLHYFERLYQADYSGWKRFAATIPEFKSECSQAGARLVAMIFPLLSDRFDAGAYPFEAQHRSIRRLMAQADVPCLDLLDAFRGKDPMRMSAIPFIDPHPSEIAHRIAAEELLEFLIHDAALLDPAFLPDESKQARKWRDQWEKTYSRVHPLSGHGGSP